MSTDPHVLFQYSGPLVLLGWLALVERREKARELLGVQLTVGQGRQRFVQQRWGSGFRRSGGRIDLCGIHDDFLNFPNRGAVDKLLICSLLAPHLPTFACLALEHWLDSP